MFFLSETEAQNATIAFQCVKVGQEIQERRGAVERSRTAGSGRSPFRTGRRGFRKVSRNICLILCSYPFTKTW